MPMNIDPTPRGPPPPLAPPPGAARQPPPPGARRPLPPRPRARPRPRPARPAGSSILGSVTKGVASLGDRIKCAAEDLYAEQQLGDKQYIRQQLDCVLNRGPCDENGTLIRSECYSCRGRASEGRTHVNGHISLAGMAPDILRGLCPRPCDECKRNKIRKAMAVISREYPREWSDITRQYGR